MNNQLIEALKRIQEEERWLEIHGLLEPLTQDLKLDMNMTRDTFEQVNLYKEEK